MIYIGIDPGLSGGIAVLSDTHVGGTGKMPATERDVLDMLRGFVALQPARAMLEKVRSSPVMSKPAAFTFGCGYGGIRMALAACEIPFDEVAPQTWQKALGVSASGIGKRAVDDVDKTAKKNAHKRRAQELFPLVTVTHAIADALLIAEYCRRINRLREGA